jgi:protein phosphatase
MGIKIRSYIASDRGRVRASNQDSGFAGEHLFLVADGMGGHAGGDIASAIVTQHVAKIDRPSESTDDAQAAMLLALTSANNALTRVVRDHSDLAGLGTTFSGLMVHDSKFVMAHIGDSRIYRKRGKTVKQMTADHTFVQRLLDLGRITPEEALHHPRRSVLMRVLGDVSEPPEIDFEVLDAKPGDRWLICSDGLSGVVPEIIMRNVLLSDESTDGAVDLLIREALEYGAPDNVTVALLDVQADTSTEPLEISPRFVGSAANEVVLEERKGSRILRLFNPMLLNDFLGRNQVGEEFAPESDEFLDLILSQTVSKVRNHRIRQFIIGIAIVLLAALGLSLGYNFTQTRYYVGSREGTVVIYQGIKEQLGPFKFSHYSSSTNIKVATLPYYMKQLLDQTIPANSINDVARILHEIESVQK